MAKRQLLKASTDQCLSCGGTGMVSKAYLLVSVVENTPILQVPLCKLQRVFQMRQHLMDVIVFATDPFRSGTKDLRVTGQASGYVTFM
jgi:hypothetical protein